LNWASTGAASYSVRYKTTPSATWTTVTTTSPTKAISGLSAGTAYEFQVKSVCSATSSSAYSASVLFTTATTACSVPVGLNVSLITASSATLGWTASGAGSYNVRYKTTPSTYWTTVTTTSPTRAISGLSAGTAYEFQVRSVCSSTVSSAYSASVLFTTATSACSVPAGLNVSLITASTATLGWTTSGAASYNVQYKATAAATWTSVNSTVTSLAITGLTASTAYEFKVKSICSSTSSSAYSASVVFTTAAPACNVPVGLNVSLITASTATLGWTASGAASYSVRYKTAPSAYWTTVTTTSPTKAISGLTAATAYEFQVKSVCSSTSSSAYSTSVLFTTAAPPCNSPAGLNVSMITSSSASLGWTASGAASYDVRYKVAGSSTWTSINSFVDSLAVTGLTASTTYEFQVAAICSATFSSAYSASVVFTTTTPCSIPSGLSAKLLTTSNVKLNWLSTGAASYIIYYKPVASIFWTIATSSSTSKLISGLASATTYEFQVASVCSGTSSSAFSAPVTFNSPSSSIVVTERTVNSGTGDMKTGEEESIEKSTDMEMSVFPNPVSTELAISFNSSSEGAVKVSIYSIAGILIKELEFTGSGNGAQLIRLQFDSDAKLSTLLNGTYICAIDANGKRTSRKFIIVR
jgi:hypothetical protein